MGAGPRDCNRKVGRLILNAVTAFRIGKEMTTSA